MESDPGYVLVGVPSEPSVDEDIARVRFLPDDATDHFQDSQEKERGILPELGGRGLRRRLRLPSSPRNSASMLSVSFGPGPSVYSSRRQAQRLSTALYGLLHAARSANGTSRDTAFWGGRR